MCFINNIFNFFHEMPRNTLKLTMGVCAAVTVGAAAVVPGILAYSAVRIAGAFWDPKGEKMDRARTVTLMIAAAPICIGMIAATPTSK